MAVVVGLHIEGEASIPGSSRTGAASALDVRIQTAAAGTPAGTRRAAVRET